MSSNSSYISTIEKCIFCNESSLKTILEINESDRFELAVGITQVGYQRFWRECETCGLAINCHKESNLEKLVSLSDSYYEIDFGNIDLMNRYLGIMSLKPEKSDNKCRVKRIKDFFSSWESFLKTKNIVTNKKKILDIGAGLGIFLSEFLNKEWHGDAIEPDLNAVKHLNILTKSYKNLNVFEGYFTGQELFVNYEIITLNKVIEHVKDPISLLRKVHGALRFPTGLLYIEVPHKSTIQYRPPSCNILGSLHYNLYDIESLSILLKKAEFIPLNISTIIEPSGKISVYTFAISQQSFKLLVSN